jgi:hypothetical protein
MHYREWVDSGKPLTPTEELFMEVLAAARHSLGMHRWV